MIAKYLIFMVIVISVTVVAGFSIKPEKFSFQKLDLSSDPVKGLKNYYAGIIWKNFSKDKDIDTRFQTVSRVVEYNPDFKPAYLELCNSYSDYLKSTSGVRDFIRMLKDAIERFGSTEFLECYTGSMILLGRYVDAIDFLEKERAQTLESQKDVYENKIKSLKNEKNVLDLTKAMESYFQKHKNYPGDILVLVAEGYIESIPEDPYGGQYFIGGQGQIMSTSIRRR